MEVPSVKCRGGLDLEVDVKVASELDRVQDLMVEGDLSQQTEATEKREEKKRKVQPKPHPVPNLPPPLHAS